jgi:acetyl esterase/lipase
MTEFDLFELMDPAAFPAQPPPGSPRAAQYIADASAASHEALRVWPPRRFSYGPHVSHKLDVFEADRSTGLRPALVFFHGGAWCSGYPWWSSFMAPGVHDAGGVLVTPTYRLGPEHRYPAQLYDVAAAIAWVWANAHKIGIDRHRIVVGGHSAGGHLSALATLHPDALGGAGPSGSIVKACFAVSASFNVHYPDPQPGSGDERVYTNLLARPEDDRAASPVNHLAKGAPPFHIVCGENDFDRIKRTSREMAAAMESRRQHVRLEEWVGADHFDTHLALKDPRHRWYDKLREAFAAMQEAPLC